MSLSGLDLCPRGDALLGGRRPAADRRLDQGRRGLARWRRAFSSHPNPGLAGCIRGSGRLAKRQRPPSDGGGFAVSQGQASAYLLLFPRPSFEPVPSMNAPIAPHSLLETAGVEPERAGSILSEAVAGADDGELFLERAESEAFMFDDGRLKSASYDSGEGFGLRVVA